MKKFYIALLIIVFLAVLIACLCVACDWIMGSASAELSLPSDVVVADNLLLNSSFIDVSSLSSPWVATNLSLSYTSDGIVCTPTSTTGYFFYRVPYSLYTHSVNYSLAFSCLNYDVLVETFSLPSEPTSNSTIFAGTRVGDVRIRVYYYGNGDVGFTLDIYSQVTIQWSKLELGSSFTGYVFNSYTNYGYDQGYSQGVSDNENKWINRYSKYGGFSNYVKYYDFRDDTSLTSMFSSSNGGTVGFSAGNGVVLAPESTNSFTYFDFNSSSAIVGSSNFSGGVTFSLALSGTFSTGDVILTINYSYFTGSLDRPPWTGTGLQSTSVSFNLVQNKVFVYYFDMISSAPEFTLSISDTVSSVAVSAFQWEYGDFFSRFGNGATAGSSSLNSSAAYESGVSQGYSDGYKTGYYQGEIAGTDLGYSNGYDAGKTVGYSDALTDFSDYSSWTSVFTALIDVPISVIVGFLDVEILGFNFLSLFRSLILLSLFVYVLKVLVGKYA